MPGLVLNSGLITVKGPKFLPLWDFTVRGVEGDEDKNIDEYLCPVISFVMRKLLK